MYRYHHLYKVIDFITLFFVWASPLLKDLHQKEISFACKISSEKAPLLCRLKLILSNA